MRIVELLVALLLVGVASSAPVISPEEVSDFTSVIPVEKIWNLVSDYLAYDTDIKNLIGYIHTEEFKHMITEIDAMPEFIEFLNSLEDSAYPAYKYWNILHTVLGMPNIHNPKPSEPPHLTGGVSGLISDVRALISEESVKNFYEKVLKAHPEFKALIEHFHGEKFKKFFGQLATLPEVKTMIEKMGLSGIIRGNKQD